MRYADSALRDICELSLSLKSAIENSSFRTAIDTARRRGGFSAIPTPSSVRNLLNYFLT